MRNFALNFSDQTDNRRRDERRNIQTKQSPAGAAPPPSWRAWFSTVKPVSSPRKKCAFAGPPI